MRVAYPPCIIKILLYQGKTLGNHKLLIFFNGLELIQSRLDFCGGSAIQFVVFINFIQQTLLNQGVFDPAFGKGIIVRYFGRFTCFWVF